MRLDFVALSPAEESRRSSSDKTLATVQTSNSQDQNTDGAPHDERTLPITHHASRITHHLQQLTCAYIPFNYISDARQRIEIYRKLAQASDKTGLEDLKKELRDRFGPLPAAIELLLQVGELKALASERAITVIEVKEDKLMLTRNNDFVMVGSKFPRLTKKTAAARVKEIKKLLLAL